jgi:prepilin-type N-terminal cleavage/methylation domain-containing protein
MDFRMLERSNELNSGFTLIEVLVAVAILAIAMVAILKANVQNLDALTISECLSVLMNLIPVSP